MNGSPRRTVWLALTLAAAASGASAAEWQATTALASSAEYDSNPQMKSGSSEAVSGAVADLTLRLGRRSDVSSLDVTSRLLVRRYTGDDTLDSDDVYVNGDWRLDRERNRYGMSASYARDGTLTSEFGDTGFVEANVPRETTTLRASANRSLSERMQVNAVLAYQDVYYQNGARFGLLDYHYWTGTAYTQRALSERSSFNLIARVALLEVPESGGESREASAGFGFEHLWNERWTSSIAIGPSYSETNGESNGTGTSYRATLAGNWPRRSVGAEMERVLSPDEGRGTLEVRDRFALALRRELSERVVASAFASVDFYSGASDPRNQGGSSRNYARAGGTLAWQAAQQWALSLSYRYLRQDESSIASGHQISAGVNWRGLGKSLSR